MDDPAHAHELLDRQWLVGNVTLSFFPKGLSEDAFAREALPVAACYREVYGTDSAWGEGKICHACSQPKAPLKWGLRSAPASCPNCRGTLEDFWPVESVIADMRRELALPDAVCVIARVDDQIIGACWGYSSTPEDLEADLNRGIAPEAQVADVARNLREQFPDVVRVAYQDEIFVDERKQGLGIGKALFAARLRWFEARDLRVYVLRTKRNPPSRSYLWFADRWGYLHVGSYPDDDQRVVLASHHNNVAHRVAGVLS